MNEGQTQTIVRLGDEILLTVDYSLELDEFESKRRMRKFFYPAITRVEFDDHDILDLLVELNSLDKIEELVMQVEKGKI